MRRYAIGASSLWFRDTTSVCCLFIVSKAKDQGPGRAGMRHGAHKLIRFLKAGQFRVSVSYSPPSPQTCV